MDYQKVNRIGAEIRSLTQEEFKVVKSMVDGIAYHGNPQWCKNNSPVDFKSQLIARMVGCYERDNK